MAFVFVWFSDITVFATGQSSSPFSQLHIITVDNLTDLYFFGLTFLMVIVDDAECIIL